MKCYEVYDCSRNHKRLIGTYRVLSDAIAACDLAVWAAVIEEKP